MSDDASHLRLLSIFHNALGGLSAVMSTLFLMHFFWGLSILRGTPFFGKTPDGDPPREVGVMLMLVGGTVVLLGWAFGACLLVAASSLASRRRYMYCLVMAAMMCVVCHPFGTVLGIFTIVVLMRPSVKAQFGVA